ncbi:MAG TPA: hypothetical protein ENG63_07490 [Candidatus Desulfofervidus auxilii]|uniref:Uncharacterized protein n=1 Tax=Desulfofervidus auxilii TaxID=1621989 RepID=A0A7C0U3S0_DESA2|nr:hypothetical protein [Candidatus Desulfofervidus auxilii]
MKNLRKQFKIVETQNGFKIYVGKNLVAYAKKEFNKKIAKSLNSYWSKEKLLLRAIHSGGGIVSPIFLKEWLTKWLDCWINNPNYYLFNIDRRNEEELKEI